MGRVLLFNFTAEARRKKVRALLFRLGLPGREIPPEDQGQTLAALLEEQAHRPEKGKTEKGFSGEMLVMHGLSPKQFHGLVDGLRAQGLLTPLKAVTTETNLNWTALRLHEELTAEREALEAGKKAVHGEND